jgi:hypothetical protein
MFDKKIKSTKTVNYFYGIAIFYLSSRGIQFATRRYNTFYFSNFVLSDVKSIGHIILNCLSMIVRIPVKSNI